LAFRLSRLLGKKRPDIPPLVAAWYAISKSRPLGDNDEIALIRFALENAQHSRSQILQDMWVAYELGEKRSGFYVEFGAADGIAISNTLMLAERYAWRGALAETHPVFLPQLRVNRPNDYICDAAIWSVSGETLEFAMTREPLVSVLTAVNPPELDRHKSTKSTRTIVRTISLNDFLSTADAPPKIDFMSIDIEGAEMNVLKTFDFDRWQVTLLCIEHNGHEAELDTFMTTRGYERRFRRLSTLDCWYRLASQDGRR
jgi:FkbM family methyltransferase